MSQLKRWCTYSRRPSEGVRQDHRADHSDRKSEHFSSKSERVTSPSLLYSDLLCSLVSIKQGRVPWKLNTTVQTSCLPYITDGNLRLQWGISSTFIAILSSFFFTAWNSCPNNIQFSRDIWHDKWTRPPVHSHTQMPRFRVEIELNSAPSHVKYFKSLILVQFPWNTPETYH